MTIEPVALDAAPRRAAAKLVIDGVSKRFGTGADAVQALKPIDIAVGAGEFCQGNPQLLTRQHRCIGVRTGGGLVRSQQSPGQVSHR